MEPKPPELESKVLTMDQQVLSIMIYYSILTVVSYAIQQDLIVYPFY